MSQPIKIHGLGSSGEGVGKLDGLAVFVEGALPGEEILAEIDSRKKNYAVGRLVEVLKKSSERVEPFCPLYKNCGGCQLQHMSCPAQLKCFLRHVMGRVGFGGEFMIVLVTAAKNFPNEKNFVRALVKELPNVTSIQQNVQTFHNNVILGRDTKILYGKQTIRDKIGGLSFNISARSFFQVNTTQAEILYKTALDFAELHGRETVIDAYCGTGTIGLFMARKARKVIGVEVVSSAVADAKKNSRENKIHNAEFFVGDAVKVLPKIFSAGVYAEVVVVDPPRAGCDKKVLETFAAVKPEKIIYVSCNPATLARDLKILDGLGYLTKKIQPVDMFPFTSHVESVTQLVRK